jgi:putative FmdB family regulatory protein
MPTYEYACPKCGHQFEQFQSMRDEPLKKCPKCKKTGLKRLVGGGAGLIFKGSGFYITDYKYKSGGKPDGGAESKPAEGKPSETKSGDAKPAASKSSEPKAGGDSKPSSSSSSSSGSSSSGKGSSSGPK